MKTLEVAALREEVSKELSLSCISRRILFSISGENLPDIKSLRMPLEALLLAPEKNLVKRSCPEVRRSMTWSMMESMEVMLTLALRPSLSLILLLLWLVS